MEYQESATFCNSMEEDQELKFLFKSCKKKKYCGERPDVIASNSAESGEKVGPTMKKVASLLDVGAKFSQKDAKIEELGGQCGQGNYGLRENPKKTRRAVDQNFPLPQEKVCKQCGEVFQSLKALCGHMACHSEKEREGGNKDYNSWTSENSESETEEEIMLRSKSRTSKIFKKVIINPSSYAFTSTCNNASSSASEIDEIEKEEVAVCLMMLSRDAGKVDISDEINDDELLAESYKRKKYGSSDNAGEVSNTPYKKSKYECLNCKKSFKSYQALGGHRPCHKRINAYSQSVYENGQDANNVADQQNSKNKKGKSEQKVRKSKKQKGHVCPFCPRVFKSGQALGGHKRTHFLVSGGSGNQEFRIHQSINKEVHDLFDLNLPAPVEDEDDNGHVQFSSW